MLLSCSRVSGFWHPLSLSFVRYRRTAEGQLKRILLKHFPEDLGAVNGSRGFERAFREMLWASEASEWLNSSVQDVLQSRCKTC